MFLTKAFSASVRSQRVRAFDASKPFNVEDCSTWRPPLRPRLESCSTIDPSTPRVPNAHSPYDTPRSGTSSTMAPSTPRTKASTSPWESPRSRRPSTQGPSAQFENYSPRSSLSPPRLLRTSSAHDDYAWGIPATPRGAALDRRVDEQASLPGSVPTTPLGSPRRASCFTPPPVRGASSHPSLKQALMMDSVDHVSSILSNNAGLANDVFLEYGFETPLCCAARIDCNPQIVRLLLQHHADVHAVNDRGLTALAILSCVPSAKSGPQVRRSCATAQILMKAGANPQSVDAIEMSSLDRAYDAGNQHLVQLFQDEESAEPDQTLSFSTKSEDFLLKCNQVFHWADESPFGEPPSGANVFGRLPHMLAP